MTSTRTRRSTSGRNNTESRYIPAGRRRWPWLLAFGLVLVLLAGGAYVVFKTPVFAVRHVTITGADGALAGTVGRASRDTIGVPLASVDTGAVRARIAGIPEVAGVRVDRTWPHTLTITVRPRIPVAVTSANGNWWLLDAEGLPYTTTPARPPRLPAIELATPGRNDPATKAALAVVTALPAAVSGMISAVTASSAYQVTLVLIDGRRVIWGDGSRTAQKAKILPVVLARPGTVFDLSDPQLVTVRDK
jgi:cell division protein FtsQ